MIMLIILCQGSTMEGKIQLLSFLFFSFTISTWHKFVFCCCCFLGGRGGGGGGGVTAHHQELITIVWIWSNPNATHAKLFSLLIINECWVPVVFEMIVISTPVVQPTTSGLLDERTVMKVFQRPFFGRICSLTNPASVRKRARSCSMNGVFLTLPEMSGGTWFVEALTVSYTNTKKHSLHVESNFFFLFWKSLNYDFHTV